MLGLLLTLTTVIGGVCGKMVSKQEQLSQHSFIWCSFFLVCVLRTFFVKFKVPLHHCIFASLCGFTAAFVVDYLHIKRSYTIQDMYYLDLLFFFLPGTVFKSAFQLDNYVFLKTLSQILVISFPVFFFAGASTGLLFRTVIKPDWPQLHAIMFGVNCAQIYATYTGFYLRRLAVHMKHTSSLLDGEAIISNINCYVIYVLFVAHSVGVVVEWYHFVFTVLRLVLVGLVCGYVFGLLGRLFIRSMCTDHLGVVMLIFAVPYFTFGVTEIYFGGCGTIAVLIIGLMMSKERTTLSAESDQLISNFWHLTEVLLTILICLTASFTIAYHYIDGHLSKLDWIFTLITYILYGVVRFISFLLFVPIISRLGYGMNAKSMLICVFGGLKHPLCLLFSGLYNRRVNYPELTAVDKAEFNFHVFGLFFLSYLINGAFIPLLLRVMGVAEVSMAKQVNMNNCMKHIFAKRDKAVAVLKTDRYVNDANWALVNVATAMRRPDKVDSQADDDDDDGFFTGYRFTYCPDCKKDVAEEPTKKELKDMSREAKMRVLKAMRMSYVRQYENGMVSKEGIRILNQAVELAMDTEEAVILVDGLHKKFNKESWFKRFIRKRVHKLTEKTGTEIKAPRTYWTRRLYRLVMYRWFNHFIYFVNFINVLLLVVAVSFSMNDLVQHVEHAKHQDHWKGELVFSSFEVVFFLIYLFEFVARILAYSRYGIRSAFHIYFRSVWNTLDFIVLCICSVDLIVEIIQLLNLSDTEETRIWWCHLVLSILKMSRALKLLQIVKVYYPLMIRYLNTSVDANMAFTYELGKAYVTGVDEVSKMLPQIVDHDRIKNELKQRLEQDRILITKLLGLVQKERPWIAITVKTKQAIRTVNNTMKESIMQLKSSGWTDQMEHEKLMKSLGEVYKHVNSIKSVQPSAPEVIFKEVAWMAGDETVLDFLFENVTVKKFEPGDVVFGEGMVADGIYVVVTGLFLLTYVPDAGVLNNLQEYGQLPIADYVLPTQYRDNVADYIVSGNCMGELSTLTGRPYNCTITADAHSQVYVLSNNVMRRAMELSEDPVNGLQCRIWKAVSTRLAVPLLMEMPTFQSFSLDQIKYTLESSFMPDLSAFRIFAVTEMIQDIILIEGLAADFHTRELFVAPVYIPRTVQKLILPKSSLMEIPIYLEVRLLIIPEKDVDEIDVMLMAEETCELVAQTSSIKCLQHTIQNRSSRTRRRNRGKALMEVDSSSLRKRRYGLSRSVSSNVSSNRSRRLSEEELYLSNIMSSPIVNLDASEEEINTPSGK